MTENEIKAAEISQRIQLLESMSLENLKGEMSALKKAILENPQACMLLLDEDVGKMVVAIRKITGLAIQTAASKKKEAKAGTSGKTKKLTAEELAAALDDEDF